MKLKLDFGQRSFFSKIFFWLIIIVLIIIICCYCLLFYVQANMKETKMQEQDTYISAYSSYMEDVFKNINNILSYIESDPETIKVLLPGYQEKSDYFQSQNGLINTINRFSALSEEINEIYIYPLYHDYLYTVSGVTSTELYFDNRFTEGYNKWKKNMTTEYNGMKIMYYSFPIQKTLPSNVASPSRINILKSIKSGNRTLGTLVVPIKETIVQGIFKHKEFANGRYIYIVDESYNVLSTNSERSFQEVFNGIDMIELKEQGRYMNDDGLCSYRTSKITDAGYFIFTPKEIVTGDFERFFMIANIILSVLGIFMIYLAYCMSKKIYKPFNNLVDILKDISVSEKTGKDELDDVRMKIIDIVSLNYSLKNKVDDSSRAVLESILFKIIFGSPIDDHMLVASNRYNISFQNGYYNLFVVYIDTQQNIEDNFYQENFGKFESAINKYLDDWVLATVMTQPDEYSIITYSRECENTEKVIEVFYKIQDELIKMIPNYKFYIGCGNWVPDVMKLSACYTEAVNSIRQRSINSTRSILMPKTNFTKKQYYLPNDLELEISNYFSLGRKEAALQYVSDILGFNLKKNISTEAYITICNTINCFVIRYLEYHRPDESELLITIDLKTTFYSAQRLDDIVLSNLNMAFDLLSEPEGGKLSPIAHIIQYVDDNFNKDINLSIVADKMGYTPNYLSRYFKQVKGINFTDYLNRKKIDYSKMLLTTTSKTIKQVTQDAGFNSAALFIKTFEKYEGVTPGEFKKNKQRSLV